MAYAANLMPPPARLLFSEGWRALHDLGHFSSSRPHLYEHLPRGDGHAVLVLPGFLTRNSSTFALRRVLRRLGYGVAGWTRGRNLGLREGVAEAMSAQLESLANISGRKVSIVGQSLGGTFARELAKRHPDWVRLVVTLGGPIALHPRATNAWRVYEWTTGKKIDDAAMEIDLSPPDVPCTAIYSRTDGVVAWRGSMDVLASRRENIEIESSHIGMGVHPASMIAIADRLAQPEGTWHPFQVTDWSARYFPHMPAALMAAA